jgi:hypothetical protein
MQVLPPEPSHERGAPAQRPQGALSEFLSSTLRLDPTAIERGLDRMRRRHPGEGSHALARRCATRAAWLAGGASLVLGLPDHPALAIPAAMVESALLTRIQRVAVARIALLHEERMLCEGLDPVGVLKAVLGGYCAAEAAVALGTAGGRKALTAAARHLTEVDTTSALSGLLKRAGVRACGPTTLIKAIPLLGALAAGVTAARAVRRETDRALEVLGAGRGPSSAGAERVTEIPRRRPSAARRAALELTVAGIRASDALSAFFAQARARARSAPEPATVRAA